MAAIILGKPEDLVILVQNLCKRLTEASTFGQGGMRADVFGVRALVLVELRVQQPDATAAPCRTSLINDSCDNGTDSVRRPPYALLIVLYTNVKLESTRTGRQLGRRERTARCPHWQHTHVARVDRACFQDRAQGC